MQRNTSVPNSRLASIPVAAKGLADQGTPSGHPRNDAVPSLTAVRAPSRRRCHSCASSVS